MQGRVARRRRTQEERSATTRRKVIDAAIDCIAEEGLRRATTTRVARRAGVTWGAIQHQFGDKETILRAVMQRGVDELQREFEAIPEDLPVRERIHTVVQRTWDVFNRPFFRAFLEVALATRQGADGANGLAELLEEFIEVIASLWGEVFPAGRKPTREVVTAQRLAFHALSGAALETLLRPSAPPAEGENQMLEEMLYDLLAN